MLWVFLSIPPVSSVLYREIGGFTILIGVMHIARSKNWPKGLQKDAGRRQTCSEILGRAGRRWDTAFYRTIGIWTASIGLWLISRSF